LYCKITTDDATSHLLVFRDTRQSICPLFKDALVTTLPFHLVQRSTYSTLLRLGDEPLIMKAAWPSALVLVLVLVAVLLCCCASSKGGAFPRQCRCGWEVAWPWWWGERVVVSSGEGPANFDNLNNRKLHNFLLPTTRKAAHAPNNAHLQAIEALSNAPLRAPTIAQKPRERRA